MFGGNIRHKFIDVLNMDDIFTVLWSINNEMEVFMKLSSLIQNFKSKHVFTDNYVSVYKYIISTNRALVEVRIT